MLRKKEMMTAAGTLAIAVGIGFAMQSGDAARERYGAAIRPVDQADAHVQATIMSDTVDVLLDVQEIELTSASGTEVISKPSIEMDVNRASVQVVSDLVAPDTELAPIKLAECQIKAAAKPIAGAMVNLTLSAPCAPNERLTVHHNGMMFTQATDSDGLLELIAPALTEQAVFVLAFANGDGAVVETTVYDLDQFDRVALQWRGRAGFQLHAREFGADYNAPGHVWAGTAPDVLALINGESGFLMQLGDANIPEPLLAEVYTFQTAKTVQDGIVDLSVEAEVTAMNCGREIEAQSIEMAVNGSLKTQDLVLAVPGCDAIGSFLVLNNLVSDLRVAFNQ
jgi:hypothetical protein